MGCPIRFLLRAAARVIGSFVYVIELRRAPRAALDQPKSSQEFQSAAPGNQEPPIGNVPDFIEKPYESYETSTKSRQKHRARATPDQFLLLFTSKTVQREFRFGSSEMVHILRNRWQELRLGPSLARAPVARMMVVLTNFLEL